MRPQGFSRTQTQSWLSKQPSIVFWWFDFCFIDSLDSDVEKIQLPKCNSMQGRLGSFLMAPSRNLVLRPTMVDSWTHPLFCSVSSLKRILTLLFDPTFIFRTTFLPAILKMEGYADLGASYFQKLVMRGYGCVTDYYVLLLVFHIPFFTVVQWI